MNHAGSATRNGLAFRLTVVLTAAWAVLVVTQPLGDSVQVWLSNVGQVTAALLAGGAAVWRGLASREQAIRRFWLALGIGCTGWGLGQSVWTYYESGLGQPAPFPSIADVGYLSLPLFVVLAFVALPAAARAAAGRARGVIDGALIATSFLLCSWTMALAPVYRAGFADGFDLVVSFAYPIGDTVIITLMAYSLMRERRTTTTGAVPIALVSLGVMSVALADVAFVYLNSIDGYATGSYIDVGWGFGFALILIAATGPAQASAGHLLAGSWKPVGLMVPYTAVGAAVITTAVELLRTRSTDHFVGWSLTVILVLLVARQILTVQENYSLTGHLEDRVAARTTELQAGKARFAALVAHSSDVVTVLDADGVVTYQSDSSRRVLGQEPGHWVGRPVTALIAGEAEAVSFLEAFRYAAAEPLRIHTVASVWQLESGRCDVEVTFTNLLDDPDVGGIVLNTRNVTDRKFLEDQLVHQAFHDTLTGLANRALFRDRLEHAMTRRESVGAAVSVIYTDLDGFKTINDTRGHGSGDVILCQVAERILSQVRASDTVARIGGDEFAVLVEDLAEPHYVSLLADRIAAALREPFLLDEQEIHLSGSSGIADLTPDVLDAEQLLRNADLAMYRAKAVGDGGHVFYAPEMHASLVEQMRLESDLRLAVEHGDFVVHYQPLVSLGSGRISGVEALVRWNHPDRGLVPPDDFIPTAESTGLIRPLGLWVLREACLQMSMWQRDVDGSAHLRINVNMSARQLQQPDLVEQIAEVLADTGLRAQTLTLEMTESVLLDNSEETLRTLTRIRQLGVRLAIDDFGTGYSSLSYLHQFPVDTLKIDRSFIQGLSSGGDTALVTGILQLAQSLGMESVAEGITREKDARMLQEHGCTTGQGFYYSPAVPAEEMTRMFDQAAPGLSRV